MSYNIFLSSTFEKSFKELKKKYPSAKDDLALLVASLKADPFLGTPLGKNCYKIRLAIASKGKGKSSGARVISCVKVIQKNIILLSIYDKSKKENLEDNELNSLLEAAGLL